MQIKQSQSIAVDIPLRGSFTSSLQRPTSMQVKRSFQAFSKKKDFCSRFVRRSLVVCILECQKNRILGNTVPTQFQPDHLRLNRRSKWREFQGSEITKKKHQEGLSKITDSKALKSGYVEKHATYGFSEFLTKISHSQKSNYISTNIQPHSAI